MPHVAGKWKNVCPSTAITIVRMPKYTTAIPPSSTTGFFSVAASNGGSPAGTDKESKNAVTTQPTIDAGNR